MKSSLEDVKIDLPCHCGKVIQKSVGGLGITVTQLRGRFGIPAELTHSLVSTKPLYTTETSLTITQSPNT